MVSHKKKKKRFFKIQQHLYMCMDLYVYSVKSLLKSGVVWNHPYELNLLLYIICSTNSAVKHPKMFSFNKSS